MTAHVHIEEQDAAESTAGTVLLPIFGLAVVFATVAICLVIAIPSVVTMLVALVTVIGCAAGIVAVLGHVIGPEDD